VSSAGARLQEGLAALAGYGEIFAAMTQLSGVVPQISILSGVSAGGGAYSPALGDVVIMTRDASMFLTGPGVVRDVMGEDVDAISLGGAKVQSANGVCHMVADDESEAVRMARDLLGLLPSAAGDALPIAPPLPSLTGDPDDVVPTDPRKVYDVRDVLERIVDDGWLLQYGELWARNIVCAWARVEGRPVGVVANQPRYIGGVLDAEAAQKAARFVRTCHLFGVPLVAFVDTPGFMPGTKQESAGVIRHGAKLVHAFAEARVPKLTVTLRKSFGGAHIAMNSKGLGADLCFAWPQATLGVMGAEQAVNIVHRRHLAAAEDVAAERANLATAYAEEHLGAHHAASQGYVDEVIEPSQTRDRLAAAFAVLDRTPVGDARARNVPL
jgi:acetyl-CoA carboxylase carboxyltransferase component